jgi:hypothetical protein
VNQTVDLVSLAIQIVIAAVVLAPVLWIVGKYFVGKDKAKFTDALWIGVLGVLIGAVVSYLLSGLVAALSTVVMIFVWIALIKHFFDCSWPKALVISIIAWIVYWVITLILFVVLQALGFAGPPTLW